MSLSHVFHRIYLKYKVVPNPLPSIFIPYVFYLSPRVQGTTKIYLAAAAYVGLVQNYSWYFLMANHDLSAVVIMTGGTDTRYTEKACVPAVNG